MQNFRRADSIGYMTFSTRTTYGLRAMINLAKQANRGSVSLSAIANQEKISFKYLERLFAGLKKAGLVKSAKGAAGGYRLAKNARQINVYDIIKSLEGSFKAFHCTDENEKIYCGKACNCQVSQVLLKVDQAIAKTLKKIKLSQLI